MPLDLTVTWSASVSAKEQPITTATVDLIRAIAQGDWNTYKQLCAPDITCFEPEAFGHCVHGYDLHSFFFKARSGDDTKAVMVITLNDPQVRFLGENAAVVTYVRINQSFRPGVGQSLSASEETRVWEKRNGQWIHVHFHRTGAPSSPKL